MNEGYLNALAWVFGHPFSMAIFGCCVGSFMNVVYYRYPLGKSVVHPGSSCPQCHNSIAFYDNIPVLAWFFLRGKCRHCGLTISRQYPLVEFLYGLLFFICGWLLPSLHSRYGVAILLFSTGSILFFMVRIRRAPWYLWILLVTSIGLLTLDFF